MNRILTVCLVLFCRVWGEISYHKHDLLVWLKLGKKLKSWAWVSFLGLLLWKKIFWASIPYFTELLCRKTVGYAQQFSAHSKVGSRCLCWCFVCFVPPKRFPFQCDEARSQQRQLLKCSPGCLQRNRIFRLYFPFCLWQIPRPRSPLPLLPGNMWVCVSNAVEDA